MVRDRFGRLDFAVNNAGIGPHGLLSDATEDQLQRAFDVNVKGVFFGIKAAAKAFIDQKTPGSIVNISSVAGASAIQGIGVYTATKHAVNGLTKTAAKEYGEYGIRINAIMPNAIRTPLAEASSKEFIDEL